MSLSPTSLGQDPSYLGMASARADTLVITSPPNMAGSAAQWILSAIIYDANDSNYLLNADQSHLSKVVHDIFI